jgi:hypothetical protein
MPARAEWDCFAARRGGRRKVMRGGLLPALAGALAVMLLGSLAAAQDQPPPPPPGQAAPPDQAAAPLGGISHLAVARHRQNHIERPARAVLAAVNKGRYARQERDQLVAAAESGDTAAAFLALNQIAADLRKVQERLERTADAAEVDKERLAVASLSGQQLRAAEVRAKLGGVGGYATPRTDKGNATPLCTDDKFLRSAPDAHRRHAGI